MCWLHQAQWLDPLSHASPVLISSMIHRFIPIFFVISYHLRHSAFTQITWSWTNGNLSDLGIRESIGIGGKMWFLSSQGWFYATFNIQPLVIYRTVIKTQLSSYFWQLPCIVLAASPPTRYLLLSNTLWGSRLPFAWYSWTPMLYQLLQMSSLCSSRQPHLTHSSFEMCQVIWRVASKWNTKLQRLTNLWQKVSGQHSCRITPHFFFFFFFHWARGALPAGATLLGWPNYGN